MRTPSFKAQIGDDAAASDARTAPRGNPSVATAASFIDVRWSTPGVSARSFWKSGDAPPSGNVRFALYAVARTAVNGLSLIHISEPTRLLSISYAVFCL